MATPLIRKDIRKLSVTERDDLVWAFYLIQRLDPEDDDSYFRIAGYHGEPFRGAGYGNPQWWGGYCNHGNILFPTWHRAYLFRLEKALQKQVRGVTIPYWNEVDDDTSQDGLPEIFLQRTYEFADNRSDPIPNPLWSYTFQRDIVDRLQTFPDADYSKPAGTSTCRFPFSGLYGEPDRSTTDAHNSIMNDLGPQKTDAYLNDNIRTWLNFSSYKTSGGSVYPAGVKDRYEKCLTAPNYTVFSNTTSAAQWNDDHATDPGFSPVVPLESPHNAIHLAIGGIQIPVQDGSSIPGANGDMGENDTAAFDPIFFFHHAFIDYMFWRWQVLNGQTKQLDIEPRFFNYPGTNSVDSQGPTPGVAGGTWLTLDSPLDPFSRPGNLLNGRPETPLTSRDVINIKYLGYTYELPKKAPSKSDAWCPHISITGINRAAVSGSFIISAWAFKSNSSPPQLIGTEPILSRRHVSGCANCQSHLEVRAHLPLEGWTSEEAEKTSFQVLLHTRASPGGLGSLKGKAPNLRVVTPPGNVVLLLDGQTRA